MHYADAGGIASGAFSGGRLVGIGVVVPHIRAAIAQLAFLHVSEAFRAAGVGSRLSADLELVARHPGDTEIVVSATPSENTVRFYLGRGYQPMARPLAGAPRAGARGRPHGEGDLNHCSVWRGGVGSVRRRVATHRAAWDGRAVRMISNSPWPLVSVDSALRSGDESSARYTGKRSRIHTVLSALSIGCAGLPGGALRNMSPLRSGNSAFCDAAGVSSSGSAVRATRRGPIRPPPVQFVWLYASRFLWSLNVPFL